MHPQMLTLKNGVTMPTLGQGTWFMGESRAERKNEVAALQHGISLGLTLIDTAEMYGSGGAEEVVGEAIAGRRSEVFLVSKVLPSNASRNGTVSACERSLRRMKTEVIDLYLLHWPGSYPLEETFGALNALQHAGKIRAWGVSNFDTSDVKRAAKIDDGNNCVNQLLYNLGSRGIEWDLLPWQKERNIATMAYSPLHQTHLLKRGAMQTIAKELGITPAQLALSWLLHQKTIPIPKSSNFKRIEENRKAWDITLSPEILKKLDQAFPPPSKKVSLDIL
ncbi:MAG: aldo/keto reductase [Oxalobacter sp.]|nr:MAG: aldo/keto reductase [Oxalobacter sp.]